MSISGFWAGVPVLLLVSAGLFSAGISWGLPSEDRLALVSSSVEARQSLVTLAREYLKKDLWQDSSITLANQAQAAVVEARPLFNVVRSYHPDEQVYVKALARMRPSRLDFNPHYFGNPALFLYSVGAAISLASLLGWVTVTPDILFYIQNPDEMGKIYIVGRLVTIAHALGVVFLAAVLARRLLGEGAALVAGAILAVLPVLVVNAHYIKMDVPLTFWWLATIILFLRVAECPSPLGWLAVGAVGGLAFATRYTGGLLLPSFALAYIGHFAGADWRWKSFSFDRLGETIRGKGKWFFGSGFALAFLLANPFSLVEWRLFLAHFGTGFNIIWQLFQGTGITVRGDRGGFFESLPDATNYVVGWELAAIVGLAGLGAMALRGGREARTVALASVPWIMFGLANRHKVASYLLPLAPILAIGAAWVVSSIWRRGGWGKIAAAFVFLVMIVQPAGVSMAYDKLFIQTDPRDEAGLWIRDRIPAGSRIGFLNFDVAFRVVPIDAAKYRVVDHALSRADEEVDFLVLTEWDTVARSAREQRRRAAEDLDGELRRRGFAEIMRFDPRAAGILGRTRRTTISDDFVHPAPYVRIMGRSTPGIEARS